MWSITQKNLCIEGPSKKSQKFSYSNCRHNMIWTVTCFGPDHKQCAHNFFWRSVALMCWSRAWTANNSSCADFCVQLAILPVVSVSCCSSVSPIRPTFLLFTTSWKTVDQDFITRTILMLIIARGRGIGQKDKFYKVFIRIRCTIRLFTFWGELRKMSSFWMDNTWYHQCVW